MNNKIILQRSRFDLKEILDSLPKDLGDCNWAIFEFDGVLKSGSSFDVNKISNQAVNLRGGVRMTRTVLTNFAAHLREVHDLILAGNVGEIFDFEDTACWRERHSVVIETLDGGEWEIFINGALSFNDLAN